MLEHTVIDGQEATVAYLHNDWTPAEKGEEDFVKVRFDDGRVVFAVPVAPDHDQGRSPSA
jgi:hypothetical protein